MHDVVLAAGILATLGVMAGGIKVFGVGGGFAGFIAGAAMTGIIAANAGVELGAGECERYSSIANDC